MGLFETVAIARVDAEHARLGADPHRRERALADPEVGVIDRDPEPCRRLPHGEEWREVANWAFRTTGAVRERHQWREWRRGRFGRGISVVGGCQF